MTKRRHPETDADLEAFPLMTHVIELRQRLIVSFAAFLAGTLLCYLFAENIYEFLVRPLAEASGDYGHRLIYTGLAEAFMTYLKLSMWGGFALAVPVIATQIWRFFAPALFRNERQFLVSLLIASPSLFLLGAAMAYYLVFPLAWRFFLSFEVPIGFGGLPIQMEARVSEYLSLSMSIIMGFGLAFQLPVVLVLLARMGLVGASQLVSFRRFAIVLIFAVAAVLTPPDAISQICLAVPMMILYEASIFGARWVEKRRSKS